MTAMIDIHAHWRPAEVADEAGVQHEEHDPQRLVHRAKSLAGLRSEKADLRQGFSRARDEEARTEV